MLHAVITGFRNTEASNSPSRMMTSTSDNKGTEYNISMPRKKKCYNRTMTKGQIIFPAESDII